MMTSVFLNLYTKTVWVLTIVGAGTALTSAADLRRTGAGAALRRTGAGAALRTGAALRRTGAGAAFNKTGAGATTLLTTGALYECEWTTAVGTAAADRSTGACAALS